MSKATKRWTVNACIAGSKHLGTFDADSGQDAIDMAVEERGYVSFCHACSRQCEDAQVTSAHAETEDGDEAHWTDEYWSWMSEARAAGWTPPKKARAKKKVAS